MFKKLNFLPVKWPVPKSHDLLQELLVLLELVCGGLELVWLRVVLVNLKVKCSQNGPMK